MLHNYNNSLYSEMENLREAFANRVKEKYPVIKEEASKIHQMWKNDTILKSDIITLVEIIVIQRIVSNYLNETVRLIAEISTNGSKITLSGFTTCIFYELLGEKRIEWLEMSSEELWQEVIKGNHLLAIVMNNILD